MLGLAALLGLLALGLSFDALSSDDSSPSAGADPETGDPSGEAGDEATGIAQQLAAIMQELGEPSQPDGAPRAADDGSDDFAGDMAESADDQAEDDAVTENSPMDAPEQIDDFDPSRDVVVVEVGQFHADDPEFTLRDGEQGGQILSLDGFDIARINSLGAPFAEDMVRLVSA